MMPRIGRFNNAQRLRLTPYVVQKGATQQGLTGRLLDRRALGSELACGPHNENLWIINDERCTPSLPVIGTANVVEEGSKPLRFVTIGELARDVIFLRQIV